MAVQPQNGIRQQAELLARENREADPSILGVFWFKHQDQIRLVETTQEVPRTTDGKVHPFYFPPSPQDGLSAPSAVALIRPEEAHRLSLPPGWGEWDDAEEL